MTQQKAVAKKGKTDSFMALIEKAKPRLAEVAPKWISIERLIRLALAARSRNPKLAQCNFDSFMLFCMRCSETGLEPIGAGGAWPVPFYNGQIKQMEVQFIPDWRGLIQLAKKTEQIKHAYGEIVCENDTIHYQKGDNPRLDHEPALKDRGDVMGAYCVVVLPDDSKHIEYMSFEEIEAIRNRSKAKDNGPWKTDWSQMAIKTVVKRALKPFSGSPEMQTAIEYDNQATGFLEPIQEPVAVEDVSQELPPEKQEENISQETKEAPKPIDSQSDMGL